jgi:hypothetical protein
MEAKFILTLILISALIYFRFSPGVRLLKKKSNHYIVPPACEDDPNWIPIEINEYKKTVFFKQNSQDETIEAIKNAVSSEFPEIEFEVFLNNGVFRLNVFQSTFSDFHHLISFCTFNNGEGVIGFCENQKSKNMDFIVKLDTASGNAHMIGSFRTNQNFGIYLPKSEMNPKGNISKSPVKEIDFQNEINQLEF